MIVKKRFFVVGILPMALMIATVAVAARQGATPDGPSLYLPVVRHDNVFWALAFDPSPEHHVWDVAGTIEGGMVVAGRRGRPYEGVWLERLDARGMLVWSGSSAGGRLRESGATAVQPTADGGFLLMGSDYPEGWLSGIDRDGAAVWQKSYSHPLYSTFFGELQPTSDGSYIVVGTLFDPANVYSLGLLAKVNPAGAVQWAYSMGQPENRVYYSLVDVVEVQPGRFVALVHRALYDPLNFPETLLVEVDSSGNVYWARSFSVYGLGLARGSDGKVAIAGTIYNTKLGPGGWLAKIDIGGAVLWQRTYFVYDSAAIMGIDATSDGFLLSGRSYNPGANELDSFLARVDGLGNILWTRNYGEAGLDDLPTAVRQTPSGAILLSTLVQPEFTAQLDKARAYKLETDGTIQACQAITEVAAVAMAANESSSSESMIAAPQPLVTTDFSDWTSGLISRAPFCPATD